MILPKEKKNVALPSNHMASLGWFWYHLLESEKTLTTRGLYFQKKTSQIVIKTSCNHLNNLV